MADLDAAQRWAEAGRARYLAEVADGQHDTECEQRPRFYLCHCSKRRREDNGFTELPGALEFPPPYCPRCLTDAQFDGDCWLCPKCPVTWSSDGSSPDWTDDHGDLAATVARWEAIKSG